MSMRAVITKNSDSAAFSSRPSVFNMPAVPVDLASYSWEAFGYSTPVILQEFFFDAMGGGRYHQQVPCSPRFKESTKKQIVALTVDIGGI